MKIDYTYGNTLLKIDHVSFSYGPKAVLRDLDAEVKDVIRPGCTTGQVIAIVGQSGRGKTTTFENLSGLMTPNSGQVLIPEASGMGFRPVRVGDVGVVAQNYPLLAHRKVLGNLLVALEGSSPADGLPIERAKSSLEEFGLLDKIDSYPMALSGGERQRVAIMQMLLRGQSIILMDEPFASLDLVSIEKTCAAIAKAANAKETNTIIVITHDISAAVAIADHIWMLGFERDSTGNPIPGARIIETYDLLDKGLCYEPGIITSDAALAMIKEIKDRFRSS